MTDRSDTAGRITIRLHNSLTRKREDFVPLDPENVRLYVCGPTVYDRAHLGNARPVVVFDVLYRLLRHVYGREHVTYVRNFTDVDDKIIARVREMKDAGDPRPLEEITRDLTDRTIEWYHADMDALGALRPTHEPRATEYIEQMIAMIRGLVESGHAYVAEGHVLFDVASYPDYGRLSGRSVEDMIAGARVEVAPYKRDPMDFVLWKPSDAEQPGWDSPWGRGRPGWHIECSAMSEELLGPRFDIHGGGGDLMFPHHENEIAQSCCAHPAPSEGRCFAQVWMHNEMLQVEGRKMSKSLGNFFTVRDLLDKGIPGEVIRFVLLGTHYRKPMDWTERKVREATDKLGRWYREIAEQIRREEVDLRPPSQELVAALAKDLNTPAARTELEKLDGRIPDPRARALQRASDLSFLGLLGENLRKQLWPEDGELEISPVRATWIDPAKASVDPVTQVRIDALVDDRTRAKKARDYALADAIRDRLAAAGVVLKDTPDGTTWEAGPDFDPAKLEGRE